jgi:transposase
MDEPNDSKRNPTMEFVGLDVGKDTTAICVKDVQGKVLAQATAGTCPAAIFEALRMHCDCPERIVLETGSQSGWLHRELVKRGLPVVLVDARQAHAVMKLQHNKTDSNDAALLADLARTGFYRGVAAKSTAAHEVRALLKARDLLVRQRRDIDNTIRGLLRSFGLRLPKGKGRFVQRVEEQIAGRPELTQIGEALLATRSVLVKSLQRLDDSVEERAQHSPVCRLLMTAPGVGPVTALAFAATIDDPSRFSSSQSVGAYVGLTARRYQSGTIDITGRISKMGDAMIRRYLYEAAQALMCLVRRACPLKTWARKLKKRIGHKKACVAVARKLAVVLHRMWHTGEAFRWPSKAEVVA